MRGRSRSPSSRGGARIRKDETLVLWLKATPADAKLRKAVTATASNKKWAAKLAVSDASLLTARAILEAAATALPSKTPAKKPAAKKQSAAVKA